MYILHRRISLKRKRDKFSLDLFLFFDIMKINRNGKPLKIELFEGSVEHMNETLDRVLVVNNYYYIEVRKNEIVLTGDKEHYITTYQGDTKLPSWENIFAGLAGAKTGVIESDIFECKETIVSIPEISDTLIHLIYSRCVFTLIQWLAYQSTTIGVPIMIQCEHNKEQRSIIVRTGFENDVMLELLAIYY